MCDTCGHPLRLLLSHESCYVMSAVPHMGGPSGRLSSDWSMGRAPHTPPEVSREIHCYILD